MSLWHSFSSSHIVVLLQRSLWARSDYQKSGRTSFCSQVIFSIFLGHENKNHETFLHRSVCTYMWWNGGMSDLRKIGGFFESKLLKISYLVFSKSFSTKAYLKTGLLMIKVIKSIKNLIFWFISVCKNPFFWQFLADFITSNLCWRLPS